jgi:hypothetical protein
VSPIIGPVAWAIWKMVAPQVTAFTKCSLGTNVGTRALAAGPLKQRPVPMRKRIA